MTQLVASLFFVGVALAESFQAPGLKTAHVIAGSDSVDESQKGGSSSIWILFKEDCPACLRQIRDLDCLADGVAVHLVGFGSPETRLLRKARQWTPKRLWPVPVYVIDQKELGAAPWQGSVTPQIMFTNGTYSEVVVGYQVCDRLKDRWMTFLRENHANGNI